MLMAAAHFICEMKMGSNKPSTMLNLGSTCPTLLREEYCFKSIYSMSVCIRSCLKTEVVLGLGGQQPREFFTVARRPSLDNLIHLAASYRSLSLSSGLGPTPWKSWEWWWTLICTSWPAMQKMWAKLPLQISSESSGPRDESFLHILPAL